jgi:hypothetical protein
METKCQNCYAAFIFPNFLRIQDSLVAIAMGYRLISGVQFWVRAGDFFSTPQIPDLLCSQCTLLSWWVWEAVSSRVKRQGMKLTTRLSSTAEVKNGEAIPPLPYSSSWPDDYSMKHKENFTFSIYPIYLQIKQCCTQNPCKGIHSE